MATTYFQRSTTASNVGTPPAPVVTSRQASTTAGSTSVGIGSGTLAAGATSNAYFFTDDPAPGTDGATGDYSATLRFTTTNAQIQVSVALARVNSSGTVQGSETALSAEQSSSSSLTFGFTAEDLGTWAAGDRLRMRVQFRNSHASMSQSATMGINTSADTIDTPFGGAPPATGGTLKRWTGSAFVPGGTLKRWTGSAFATGGTLRRWTGSGWEPPP